eukprot:s1_g1531.t1
MATRMHTYSVDDARFEIVGGDLKLKDGVSLNHESESSVAVEVTTTDSSGATYSETFTIAVGDVNEGPSDISLSNASVDENAAGAVVGRLSHTYSVDDARFEIVGGDLKLKDGVSLNHESESSVAVEVTTTDSSGATYSETFTIAVGDVNEGPSDITLDNLSVDENAAGAVVGSLSTMDVDDGDTHSYTVDDARFEVVGGDLKLKDGVSLNHEAESSVAVEVTTTDASGATYSETFNIAVGDVNEGPSDITLDNHSVDENAAGAVVGSLSTTDVDDGDTHSYSVDDARFEVVGGDLKLKDGVSLNHETESSVAVEVTTTDSSGATYSETFTIAVGDVNEGPSDISLSNASVDENAAGAVVGSLSTTDVDDGDTHSYSVDDARFEVVGGDLKLKDGVSLNHEAESSVAVEVTTTDASGATYSETFNIAVGDVNEGPSDISLSNTSVDENAAGAVVGSLSTTDVDDGDSHTYTVDDARFEVVGGDLKLKDGVSLDHETESSVAVEVTTTDSSGATYSETFTIAVGDVNEGPSDISLSNASVDENSTGAVVGSLSTTDVDDGDTHSYTVDDARFEVVGGDLKLKDGVSLDHETESSVAVEVTTTDSSGATYSETFNIAVGDVNEGPSDISLSNATVDENSAGAVVGSLSTTDVDDGDTHSYSVDDARFEVVGGDLKLKDGVSLNHEAESSVAVEVTTTDASGATYSETFNIAVGDVNEGPSDIALDNLSVDENSAGAVVGSLSTTDVDDGDTHSYTVDDARFEIVGGDLKLKDGVSLNHEAESSVAVEVTTTDSSGATYSETFTIAVGDVNEGPSDISLSNASVDENSAGAVVGSLSTSDVDDGDTHSYSVDDARFEVVGGDLKLKDGVSLNHESESSVAVEVTTTDSSGATYSETFTIAVGDVNEGPSDISLSNASVDENAAGAVVGSLSTTDVDDGDTHSYSVDDARFEVVGGDLKLKDGVSLDHETESSVAVEVTTTDSSGATYSETFTIAVGDVNEGPSAAGVDLGATNEDTSVVITSAQLLANSSDVDDGDSMSVSSLSVDAQYGSLSDNGDGSWTFTPANDVSADNVPFSFTVTDGEASDSATATLDITAVADTPTVSLASTTTTIIDSSFESAPAAFVSTADGWSTDSDAIEVWSEAVNTDSASDGDKYVELNDDAIDNYDDATDIHQTVDTIDGATYTLTFDLSPRPGYDASVNRIEVVWDGVVVDTISLDGSSNSDNVWQSFEYTMTGDGDPSKLQFREAGTDIDYGRGMRLDNIKLTETTDGTVVSGSEDGTISLPDISASLGDTDGSETLALTVGNIPDGATLSDGSNTFTASGGTTSVDVSGWDLSALEVTPAANYNGTFNLSVTATATEGSNASTASDTVQIEVNVVSVNDGPSDLSLSNNSVDENAAGAVIGNLTTTDADTGDSHTYTVDDTRFEVVGGQLKLKDGVSLDYETETTVAVEVTTTDAAGASYAETFTVNVGDIADAPIELWSEDFSGLSNGTTSDSGSSAWSATDAGSDMTGNHGVESGAYEFGQVTDEEDDTTSRVVWTSETIDISGQSEIDLSFRLSETGSLEESGDWHDTFKAFAIIDGVRTEIMSQDGDSGIQDAYNFQDIGTGSTLVIEFEAKTTSGSETFSVDDISVVANGSHTPLYDISDPGDAMPTLSGATYTTDDDYDGSSGDDVIVYNGSDSDNKIEGKGGNDTLVDDNTKGELKGDDGNDTLYGRGGDDKLNGEEGDDSLYGGSGDDKLEGKEGDDILVGGTGDDELKGGKGEDVLFGGAGDDEMEGEDGSDLFIFESGNGDSDYADGGSGSSWTDTIQLQGNGGGAVTMDWTLELDDGSIESSDMSSYDLSEDASGTITFADGSEISFDNIERIEW